MITNYSFFPWFSDFSIKKCIIWKVTEHFKGQNGLLLPLKPRHWILLGKIRTSAQRANIVGRIVVISACVGSFPVRDGPLALPVFSLLTLSGVYDLPADPRLV